jgi:hypothetical protein
MSGAIPLLPSTPLWRGAQLKHRDNFTFYRLLVMKSLLISICTTELHMLLCTRQLSIIMFIGCDFYFI